MAARREFQDDEEMVERDRENERGDAAEPNAPTRTEENVSMDTILSGGTGDGVQENASEK